MIAQAKTKTPAMALIPAVAYYRMSSDEQSESIPAQRAQVEAWAVLHGYRLLRDYIDDGVSGNETKKRKDFLRMIEDAQLGEFQAIVCWHQNRFGRFTIFEAGQYIQPLIDANVHLATVSHNGIHDWNDFGQRLLYTMQQDFSNQFLHDLARDVVRGKINVASEGLWGSGVAPIGYAIEREPGNKKRKAGRLILGDPAEQALVLKIFDLYVNGRSIASILEQLNEEGIRHPRSGNQWSRSTLHNLLTHPFYTGDFVWPLKVRGRYYCARNGQVTAVKGTKSSSPGEQMFKKDNHPQIISRELFERVQERLRQHQRLTTPKNAGGGFFFTGMLFCGHCGAAMHGNRVKYKRVRTNTVNEDVFYNCSRAMQFGKGTCHHNRVKQDDLMSQIVPQIEAWAMSPQTRELLDSNLAVLTQRAKSSDTPAVLASQLTQVKKELAAASERLLKVSNEVFDIISAQVQELVIKKKDLEAKIIRVGTPPEEIVEGQQARVSECLSLAASIGSIFAESETVRVRNILSELISGIHVKCDAIPVGVKGQCRYNFVWGKIRFRDKLEMLAPELTSDLSSVLRIDGQVFGSVWEIEFDVYRPDYVDPVLLRQLKHAEHRRKYNLQRRRPK